ncbi:UvrD-helicase domain-containing protein [Streptomyces sp. NBC_00887]|uniref:UvrD-helicase domain-containing protein n=1 Tax=Streptomyces sp. NBC_00887 TaxID=2975859 RepID=UPI003869354F
MAAITPTREQENAIKAFASGQRLVLQAGAGTGKTSTLELLASSDTDRRGMYIAFNRSVKEAAKHRFPPRVQCATGHGLAYAAVGHRYQHRFGGARVPAWKSADTLGLHTSLTVKQRTFERTNLAYITKQTILVYCHSADRELSVHHVPLQPGGEDPDIHRVLAATVLPYAQRAWEDVSRPDGDKLRVEHDHYLKVWQLTDPHINKQYILLDEAQDTNPALEYVLNLQRPHAQIVLVGDSAQQIYTWRGARDIMTGSDGTHLPLSQSFRFGPALAAEANRWLHIARTPLRLTGHTGTPTRLEAADHPNAVLCRTNGGAMAEVMYHLKHDRRVAMVGGGSVLRNLALAAKDLKAGNGTRHPELYLFKTWGEVQDYAENDPAGADLHPWVDLIDDIGTTAALEAVDRLGSEETSDVTISTVHKAKGREWPVVRIGEDFTEREPEPDANGKPGRIPRNEARLAYVAITRARHQLDIGGLAWFDAHPQANPQRPDASPHISVNPWDRLGPSDHG